jgi:hypothetical protein
MNPLDSNSARFSKFTRNLALGAALAMTSLADANSPVTDADIIPILLRRCANCHGGEYKEADLDLRTLEGIRAGGKSGAVINPGKPDKSPLIQKIEADEMPPKKIRGRAGIEQVTEGELAKLRQWITDGAVAANPFGRDDPGKKATPQELPWSFKSPTKPTPPDVRAANLVRNPIDAFLLRKLEAKNLTFSPEANRLTLLRRATFALTGLPPTPEQIDAFVDDDTPGAYERLIDRLLDSPRYGESWGRFWLDLAGYADSEGKRSADMIRPYAWKYRDYVIRAFNDDKPFDQFLVEQLAGDELFDYANAKEITPTIHDALVATGFLRMAPDGTTANPVNRVEDRLEVISDEVDILARGVMGLTMNCARCHDHKYDPITQADYYSLTAVFKGAYDEYDWMTPQKFNNQWEKMKQRHLAIALPEEKHEWDAKMTVFNTELEKFNAQLAALDKSKSSEIKSLKKKINAFKAKPPTQPQIRALWDRGRPSESYVYKRGDHLLTGDRVDPGVPVAFNPTKIPFDSKLKPAGAIKTGRRLAFAKWLTDKRHPLTARVFVNRVWQRHFGEGIVRSPDNFGAIGSPPSHPELLDWLAVEFVEQGWSIKTLHRLIMTSRACRQSSRVAEEHTRLDPENTLLSRMPLRRMSAEEVHDSILQIAGALNVAQFGQPDPVTIRNDGYVTAKTVDGVTRRSVYLRHRRKEMPTILETFDLPQMNPNCSERTPSTIVTQPLHLLNDKTVHNLAGLFADRIQREAGDDVNEQIDSAFRIALGREPSAGEAQRSSDFIMGVESEWKESADPRAKALADFCHTLINSAAFLYID